MDPILAYKLWGEILKNRNLASKLKRISSRFLVFGGELLKKSFSAPLLKCVTTSFERNHIGGRTLAHKALRARYYLPTMILDAKELV